MDIAASESLPFYFATWGKLLQFCIYGNQHTKESKQKKLHILNCNIFSVDKEAKRLSWSKKTEAILQNPLKISSSTQINVSIIHCAEVSIDPYNLCRPVVVTAFNCVSETVFILHIYFPESDSFTQLCSFCWKETLCMDDIYVKLLDGPSIVLHFQKSVFIGFWDPQSKVFVTKQYSVTFMCPHSIKHSWKRNSRQLLLLAVSSVGSQETSVHNDSMADLFEDSSVEPTGCDWLLLRASIDEMEAVDDYFSLPRDYADVTVKMLVLESNRNGSSTGGVILATRLAQLVVMEADNNSRLCDLPFDDVISISAVTVGDEKVILVGSERKGVCLVDLKTFKVQKHWLSSISVFCEDFLHLGWNQLLLISEHLSVDKEKQNSFILTDLIHTWSSADADGNEATDDGKGDACHKYLLNALHAVEIKLQMINRSRNQPSDPLDWVRRGEDPPGTVVKFVCNEIGKGLFAEKEFQKGEFLVEYAGQQKLPEEIETTADQTYIFHFRSGVSNMCIDATNSTRRGKYANDEWRRPNALVKQILLGQTPKLLIFAAKNISCGEEIRFDYGQKNASWRKKGATSTGIKQNDDSQEVTACDVDLTTSGPLCHDSSTGDVNRGRSEDADIIVGDVLKPTEPFPKESITADLLSRECENTGQRSLKEVTPSRQGITKPLGFLVNSLSEVTACDVDLTTSGSLCHDSSTGDVNRGRSEDADIIVGDVLKPTEPLPKESITADLLSRECENTDIIVGDVLKPTEPLPKESITADLLSRECENTGMTVGDIRLASGLVSPKVMNISESLGQCKDTVGKWESGSLPNVKITNTSTLLQNLQLQSSRKNSVIQQSRTALQAISEQTGILPQREPSLMSIISPDDQEELPKNLALEQTYSILVKTNSFWQRIVGGKWIIGIKVENNGTRPVSDICVLLVYTNHPGRNQTSTSHVLYPSEALSHKTDVRTEGSLSLGPGQETWVTSVLQCPLFDDTATIMYDIALIWKEWILSDHKVQQTVEKRRCVHKACLAFKDLDALTINVTLDGIFTGKVTKVDFLALDAIQECNRLIVSSLHTALQSVPHLLYSEMGFAQVKMNEVDGLFCDKGQLAGMRIFNESVNATSMKMDVYSWDKNQLIIFCRTLYNILPYDAPVQAVDSGSSAREESRSHLILHLQSELDMIKEAMTSDLQQEASKPALSVSKGLGWLKDFVNLRENTDEAMRKFSCISGT